jgi:CelD/BcsL family acetyltransferase involved in cellulose biosynthesis
VRRSELVTDEARLEELAPAWDELAVALGRSFCAPAWASAWWRHARPRDAELRVVTVHEGDELVGIAPFYVARGPAGSDLYRLLAAPASARVEPLARPGFERPLAEAVGRELAAADQGAGILRLEGIPAASPWPHLLLEEWPGRRPALVDEHQAPAPTLTIGGRSFDEYLGERGRHFRKRMLAGRRKIEQADGRIVATADRADIERGLSAFVELHHARFRERGGSGVLTPGVERMLAEVARELPPDRFQLWLVDVPGSPIAAEILLSAGGEVSSWLGGFDDAWAQHQPSIQALFAAIEQAHRDGETRVDLGPGAQAYKYRFANGEEMLHWVALVPRGRRYLRRRAVLLASRLRRSGSELLSDRQRRALKRLLLRR